MRATHEKARPSSWLRSVTTGLAAKLDTPSGRRADVLHTSDLRTLAQCMLAAAAHLERGTLSTEASAQLLEWARASKYIQALLGEFPDSTADKAARKALGMLLCPQLARDVAAAECVALLMIDESIKDWLADADWEHAAEVIARTVIEAYHVGLVRGQV